MPTDLSPLPQRRLSRGAYAAVMGLALVLAGAAAYAMLSTRFPGDGPVAANAVRIGGPFRLTTQDGGSLSSDDLKGKPFAIFFGFTRCPEICPTTLAELANVMQRLGEDADRMHFVFVSLDPTRDTPAVLKQYVAAFDPRIIGLTGNAADVATTAKAYRVFWEKVPTADGDYTLNHSASVYLMDRQGVFADVIDYQEAIDTAVAKLRRLVAPRSASL
jgi:protein SCO1/2